MNEPPISSPLGPQHLPASTRAVIHRLVVDHVAASSRPRAARSRRKVFVSAVVGVAVLGGSATAAYSALGGSGSVADDRSARCYTTETYRPGNDFAGTTIGVPDSQSAQGSVTNAMDACAFLWRAGFLRFGVATAVMRPADKEYPVPDLVKCLLPDGRAAVFPGHTQLCARLGLQNGTGG